LPDGMATETVSVAVVDEDEDLDAA